MIHNAGRGGDRAERAEGARQIFHRKGDTLRVVGRSYVCGLKGRIGFTRARSLRVGAALTSVAVIALAATGCGPESASSGSAAGLKSGLHGKGSPSLPTLPPAAPPEMLRWIVPAELSPEDLAISAGELDVDPL